MLNETRRRHNLGPYASAALPLVWKEMKKRGWTHAQLARELGITSGLVAKILYGDRRPGRDLSVRFHEALGTPIEAWSRPCPEGWEPHGGKKRGR